MEIGQSSPHVYHDGKIFYVHENGLNVIIVDCSTGNITNYIGLCNEIHITSLFLLLLPSPHLIVVARGEVNHNFFASYFIPIIVQSEIDITAAADIDNDRAVYGTHTSDVYITAKHDPAKTKNYILREHAVGAVVALLYFPKFNRVIACMANGTGRCIDLITKEVVCFNARVKNCNCLVMYDEATFAAGTTDGTVVFYDVSSLKRIKTYFDNDCKGIRQLIAFSARQFFVALDEYNVMYRWCVFSDTCVTRIAHHSRTGFVSLSPCLTYSVTFDPDPGTITTDGTSLRDIVIMRGTLKLSNVANEQMFYINKASADLFVYTDRKQPLSFASISPAKGAIRCASISPRSFAVIYETMHDKKRKLDQLDGQNYVEFTAPSEHSCEQWIESINAMILRGLCPPGEEGTESTNKHIICTYRFAMVQYIKHWYGAERHRGLFGLAVPVEMMQLIGFYTMK